MRRHYTRLCIIVFISFDTGITTSKRLNRAKNQRGVQVVKHPDSNVGPCGHTNVCVFSLATNRPEMHSSVPVHLL